MEFPLKKKDAGKFNTLRTKDKRLKKTLTIMRQIHFPPLAELGHEAFRLTVG